MQEPRQTKMVRKYEQPNTKNTDLPKISLFGDCVTLPLVPDFCRVDRHRQIHSDSDSTVWCVRFLFSFLNRCSTVRLTIFRLPTNCKIYIRKFNRLIFVFRFLGQLFGSQSHIEYSFFFVWIPVNTTSFDNSTVHRDECRTRQRPSNYKEGYDAILIEFSTHLL